VQDAILRCSHRDNFTATILKKVNFHLLAGMETILGEGGSSIHYWLERMNNLDKHSLRPIFSGRQDDDRRFRELIHHNRTRENPQQSLQNVILWGVNKYSQSKRERASLQEASKNAHAKNATRTTSQKANAVKKFEEVLREKADSGSNNIFATDERLNLEWRRKLDLIHTLQEAQLSPAESSLDALDPEDMPVGAGNDAGRGVTSSSLLTDSEPTVETNGKLE